MNYAAGVFNVEHKQKIRAEQWPLDLEKAREIGKRLAMGVVDTGANG